MDDKQFQSEVSLALEKHSASLVSVLKQLVSHEYPEEVARLSFEVFTDGFTSGFPVRAFFMDDSSSEVFVAVGGEAQYPSPVDPGLLDLPFVYEESLEDALEDAFPNADSFTLAGQALIPWFAECWLSAGGSSFSRKASINLHDDFSVFDLVDQQWVNG